MPAALTTILLLTASNVFMTFAWYAHLKDLRGQPWIIAAIVSWGIALFEYLIQVPANRIGYSTLSVFVPFCLWYMNQPLRWDFLWAGLCLCGAVFFMFRGGFAQG